MPREFTQSSDADVTLSAIDHAMDDAGETHAAGILLTHGDRALFLKRSDTAKAHPGEWCCPGGSIEGGETPEQAARREMTEETGLVSGDLNQIDDGYGFVTFRQTVDAETDPTLNDEHTEFKWAPLNDPPQPLHPGVAATLKKLLGGAMDKREYDSNGWFTVEDNPLSLVGVYPYSEASVIKGGDRNKMVGVYRAPEELSDPETIKSFQLMPWTDDHPDALLGDESQGLVPPEKKGISGVIGEKTYYRDGVLYGNVKVFSEQLARKIAAGKRELSCGYRCDFIPCEGVYNGTPYQYVQKNLRGNHVSSVKEGRMGSAVRVLDAAEKFTFALDMKEPTDSTELATTVAGERAAEKGTTNGHHLPDGVNPMAAATDDKGDVKDPVKKDDKPSDLGPGTKDSMSEEQEEGMDAAECAKDADEEKADKDKDDKEAKDRKSARDYRRGARDTRKSARDRAKGARDAKAAKDKEDDDKKGKGMDAAEVTALVNSAISKVKVPSAEEIIAQVRPAIRKEEAAKASLYGRVSPMIGAFDHAEMTHVEMATYSLDKLGAPKASDPVTALDYLLVGRGHVAETVTRRFAQDGASAGAKAISAKFNS